MNINAGRLAPNRIYFNNDQNTSNQYRTRSKKNCFEDISNVPNRKDNRCQKFNLKKKNQDQNMLNQKQDSSLKNESITKNRIEQLQFQCDEADMETLVLPFKQKNTIDFQEIGQSQFQQACQNNFLRTPRHQQQVVCLKRNFEKLQMIDWDFDSDQQRKQSNKSVQLIQNIEPFKELHKSNKKIQPQDTFKASYQSLVNKIQPGNRFKCLLRRDKQNTQGVPSYTIYLQGTLQHILTVKKQGIWSYNFYLRSSNTNCSFTYQKIATLESNFLGNKFSLTKTNSKSSLMTVSYQTNLLGRNGPRKISIYLPKINIPEEYLSDCYEQSKEWRKHIDKFTSKTAQWNSKLNSYVLDFQGKNIQPSIKNFIITNLQENQQTNYVLFGKIGPDIYRLDIENPFSIMQAIALAVSTFQRKMICD